jgi:hypothetical protein
LIQASAWQPSRKVGQASAWQPGPAGERPAFLCGIACAGHGHGAITARRSGMVAWCPPVAWWPRWKAMARVSINVERLSCRARRGLAGLIEDGGRRRGGVAARCGVLAREGVGGDVGELSEL